MSGPPVLPLHIGDYIKDTPSVCESSWQHHGIYLLALQFAWNTPGCRLPDDLDWLAQKFGCTREVCESTVYPVIRRYFKKRRNWLYQKRLTETAEFVEEKSAKRRSAAKSRWGKEKPESKCNANAMHGESKCNATKAKTKAKKNIPPTEAAAPPNPEKDLFDRGKALLGPKSGGLITRLLRAKGDPLKAMAVIVDAEDAQDPREYVAAAIKGTTTARRKHTAGGGIPAYRDRTPEEIETYKDWYRKRNGREPPRHPDVPSWWSPSMAQA